MLCMIAKLDNEATEKLLSLQRIALSAMPAIKPLHGHITIAVYMGENETAFIRFCKELLSAAAPFPVRYTGLEVLSETSLIVAIPERSPMLEAMHDRIEDAYGAALNLWTRGDRWLPHTTLVQGPELDLNKLCRSMQARFVPFSACIYEIEFSRVLGSGYEIVDRIRLSC